MIRQRSPQSNVGADPRRGSASRGLYRRAVRHLFRASFVTAASRGTRTIVLAQAAIRVQACSQRDDSQKASKLDGASLAGELEILMGEALTQASYVEWVSRWLDDEQENAAKLQVAAQYAAWAALSPVGREKHKHESLFRLPHKLDPLHLVPVETGTGRRCKRASAASVALAASRRLQSDGPRHGSDGALDQAHLLHQVP